MTSRRNTVPGSLERAIEIAVAVHTGTKDKAGAPYILHPLRIMHRMDNDLARIVAVLHDVVEDGEGWDFERVRIEGFGDDIIEALRGMTKCAEEASSDAHSPEEKAERYMRFVRRAAANPVSRAVKLADLEDNLDITRLAGISAEDAHRLSRYLEARHYLQSVVTE